MGSGVRKGFPEELTSELRLEGGARWWKTWKERSRQRAQQRQGPKGGPSPGHAALTLRSARLQLGQLGGAGAGGECMQTPSGRQVEADHVGTVRDLGFAPSMMGVGPG